MDRLRVEYYAAEKKAKVYVNAVLVQTIDVEGVAVIEAEVDWKTLRINWNLVGDGNQSY